MRYVSTRGQAPARGFSDILLEGLAPDGGLYMPEHYPQVDAALLARWRDVFLQQGYAALAFEILQLYVDDIPANDLKAICTRTYTAQVFGSPQITPIRKLGNDLYLQGLSGGPTLAFKDVAMQLLGHLFEYELARRGEHLNVLGATSGDTGSAAEYAMRGKRGIRVFMLSPRGRMSVFQQAQMYSLQDANIINIAVDGVFDDCQDIVKAVSADADFKHRWRIGTVNSINWARLLAQVVYYFAGYFQVTGRDSTVSAAQDALPPEGVGSPWRGPAGNRAALPQVSFAVPSGNFGNVCAGHVARQMGLPIAQLVVATNENDVLDEFFRTGVYRVRAGAETRQTSSPSMDISKASNFERFIFDLLDRNAARVVELFGTTLARTGAFDLRGDPAWPQVGGRYGFASGKSTDSERLETIRQVFGQFGFVIDPHTANGVRTGRAHVRQGVPMIVLETALAAKFSDTIEQAIGRAPERPAGFDGLEHRPQRVRVMPADVAQIKRLIAKTCGTKPV